MRVLRWSVLTVAVCAGLAAQTKRYEGPRPEKADVPFLLQAGKLTEIESGEAQEKTEKDATIYIVSGVSSPTRTPLPEPIFLFKADKVNPERLSLFRMEVKNGNRFIAMPTRGKKGGPKPIFLMVNRLESGLYKVEVNEYLENGEYCLSPDGSNRVYCFSTY